MVNKQTVLITGASGGIGGAIAERFARQGHRVILHYARDNAAAQALNDRLKRKGMSAMCVQADISEPGQVERMISQAQDYFGPIDALVNNAGAALPQKLLTDCTPEEWELMLAVNVSGAFYCAKACIPFMVERKRGCIINISSIWGVTGGSCEVPYSASKAALIGFTRALAKELGPSNIRVNCVAPGLVKTPMNAHLTTEDMNAFAEQTPLGFLPTPEDIANAVYFLSTDEARAITGQVVSVDCGASV